MSLLRLFGLGERREEDRSRGETATVRRIAARLSRLDPTTARYLAAFAYVLARVAHADLRIEETETLEMTRVIRDLAALSEEEAALVVEIAKSQARLLGGTENYVVTREFRRVSSPEQRTRLLECLYAIAAADGTISNAEATEISAVADELGFTRAETASVRAGWRDKLAVLRDLPTGG